MTTLTLLTAILLVLLQAQAGPLQARADEATAAQEQPGTDDQDFAISFTGDTSSGFRASGSTRGLVCSCRLVFCQRTELRVGNCVIGGISFTYCCSLVD
ncbi:defensin alpha 4 [Chlorocebus sabaeus]|uniref:defensin alpha 4 n=1 Tax=Chlorocebus sabaeus TaxID=60711 RepID=UPI003BF9E866